MRRRAFGPLPVVLSALWGCAADDLGGAGVPALPEVSEIPGGKTIGPSGGRVSVGSFTLEVPEGAVGVPVRISVVAVRKGLPAEPLAESPVQVEPPSLELRRLVRVSFTTAADSARVVVAHLSPYGDKGPTWLPLAGQRPSPGLRSAEAEALGTFALVPARCCTETGVEPACSVGCDVGALHYRCEGKGGGTCCDVFARSPLPGQTALCPP